MLVHFAFQLRSRKATTPRIGSALPVTGVVALPGWVWTPMSTGASFM